MRYALAAVPLACVALLSSCSFDDDYDGSRDGGAPVAVRINVSAGEPGDLNGTRAGDDVNADEHEFMHTLRLYIVDESDGGTTARTVLDLSPDLTNNTLAQTGDLTNWADDMYILAGDEYAGERKWLGEVRNIHMYAYAPNAKEMRAHYKQAQKHLDELLPETHLRVKARLTEESICPTPDELNAQGYKRCLTTRIFKIEEAGGNKLKPGDEIIVKEWAILDLVPQNRRETGKSYTLNLLDADKHKELENEYTVEGLSQFDLPVYYNAEL